MKSVSAVLLSGGSGSRMGGSCPKQFLELNGKPVFAYALEALSGFPEIGEIVIVYREGTRKEIENIIAALDHPVAVYRLPGPLDEAHYPWWYIPFNQIPIWKSLIHGRPPVKRCVDILTLL